MGVTDNIYTVALIEAGPNDVPIVTRIVEPVMDASAELAALKFFTQEGYDNLGNIDSTIRIMTVDENRSVRIFKPIPPQAEWTVQEEPVPNRKV